MEYTFHCKGHENMLAMHKTTLEFTTDSELTKNGDCIVGVSATFTPEGLAQFIDIERQVTLTMEAEGVSDTLTFVSFPGFVSTHEMVIRLSEFTCERTFGTDATKAAKHISRALVEKLKNPTTIMTITLRS